MKFDSDVIVVGSGFGGSVSALRLTEKGYSVLVLEAGRRFEADSFPKTTWNLRRFLWFPWLGLRGIQRMDLLKEVLALSGAGVGGGSLVYANTLIEPYDDFYADPQWADIADWKSELAPWYDQARRSLGVVAANSETASDQVIRRVARRMGVADTVHPVDVAVYRGESGVTVDDPFYGGKGPTRTGCIECGGCMVGCRYEAKNTLDRNYLYLAERAGARIEPDRQVVDVIRSGDGWTVVTQRPGAWLFKRRRTHRARHVIFSAGGLGTTKLLLRLRDRGRLAGISDRVGHLVRTNSEAIVGAVAPDTATDYSHGVAITSSFRPAPQTRIEPVRYPVGSNSMGLLATILVPGGHWQPVRFLWWVLKSPVRWFKSLSVRKWSERGLILLVMQSEDNSIRLEMKRGLLRRKVTSRPGHGIPNPRWLPIAHDAARLAAEEMGGGQPMASINESMLGIPLTAHLIGGATIGASPDRGVVDPYHRVFGLDGLHVVDGSAVPANLGSNPSLTITALAERALSFWPNKGELDVRPPLGETYRPVQSVAPNDPVVPAGAPAELRSSR